MCSESIIKPVHEYTEWPKSVVPVRKENGSLRLGLNPKNLKRNNERNQYYTGTIDNLNTELCGSKYSTLMDAK